ncbi:SCO1/SenC-domain-containing protein [Phycomyces nitens]|nr:SCO1/SenC-domain-containing protein [Phycomyces nitens]
MLRCLRPIARVRPLSLSGQRWLTTSPEPKKFSWKAGGLFVATGVGLAVYFKNEKERVIKERKRKEYLAKRSFGKPNIGGPFTLVNAATEKPFRDTDLHGQFHLIYFGFTHCPDICPEELDKMSEVVDALASENKEQGNKELPVVPVFITCDPRRDTAAVVREYVKDFHPAMIGLTGDVETIKRVARSYRVYISIPDEQDDYLVDHSIFFYLMNPEGEFVDCFARDKTPEEIIESFKMYRQEYLDEVGQNRLKSV